MIETFRVKNITSLENDNRQNYFQELFIFLEQISTIEQDKLFDLKITKSINEIQKQMTPIIIEQYITDKYIEKIFDLNFLNFNNEAYLLKIHFLNHIPDYKIEEFNKNNLKKFNSFLLLFFSNDENSPLFLKFKCIQTKYFFENLKKTNDNKKFKI